jgi:hypothetical protein
MSTNTGLTRRVSLSEGLVIVGVALLGALVFRALTGSTLWALVTALVAVIAVFVEQDIAARRSQKKQKKQQQQKELDHDAD